MSENKHRRPKKSLRTILIVWFILFSIIPMTFVTWYSAQRYEKAIDNELAQRLTGNGREILSLINNVYKSFLQKKEKYISEPTVSYFLSASDQTNLELIARRWMQTDETTSLTFYNRRGRLLTSVFKGSDGEVRRLSPSSGSTLFMSNETQNNLLNKNEYLYVEHIAEKKISLILVTKIYSRLGKFIGYFEQLQSLDKSFLKSLKDELSLEIGFLKSSGQMTLSTNVALDKINKSRYEEIFNKSNQSHYFDLAIQDEPYGFIFVPLTWGESNFYAIVGASKRQALDILKNVNYAFYVVVAMIAILLVVMILFTTSAVLKPFNDLLMAIDQVTASEDLIEIPVKSKTEIGLLTESFNQMSRKVNRAQKDLRHKIQELEKANSDLVETQARLVHSSKMVSLGQLVAGVAHELNNPIGFIYSNMSHLKEYAMRLIEIAKAAENSSQSVKELTIKYDLGYIEKDLPKLVASCEDGARRTRDIVLGLRNFSRLEEAKLKEINIHDAIENTLNLLSGEIKGRLQIHRDYGQVPLISCYANQINQVLMNILSNACQAIEGSGNIWITTKRVQTDSGVDAVSISIQDSGSGMTTETAEKIFDPFFTTKGVGQGTGLGLSISYGIIENHGGKIQVRSQPGTGTEFTITLPVILKLMS